jgi:replication-associated recombination protein RarA
MRGLDLFGQPEEGREMEIQQRCRFLSRITQGAGEALLLWGDPGVGKTSLGWTLVRAACSMSGREGDYGG